MIIVDGEKFREVLGAVGTGFPQFKRQHNWVPLTVLAPPQSNAFFLQHSIADIPFSAPPEKTGVPASTPPAIAKNRNSDVSHLFIFKLPILLRANNHRFIP